jgi:hypothetical protein
MTGKMMPDAAKSEMKHSKVTMVSEDMDVLTSYLKGVKSWEGLDVPAARPCGEGIYEIVRHGFSGPLHFIYELELPILLGDLTYCRHISPLAVQFNYNLMFVFRPGTKGV